MAKTYAQVRKQIQARMLAACPLHQAAIKAGVSSYPVPVCGSGFTGHHRATTTGRCIDCARLYRVKVKNQKAADRAATAARGAAAMKTVFAEAAAKAAAL